MEGLIPHILVAALAAYLLGNLNGAVTVSSLLDRDDVRTHGSGNAGRGIPRAAYAMLSKKNV